MFESRAAEEKIIKSLTQEQIDEVQDEYYSYIDVLRTEFSKYNKCLQYSRIDQFNYIICVK